MITRSEAEKYISGLLPVALAHGQKPGTWYQFHNHVYGVAAIAEKIAEQLGTIDPERAWVAGLMHDAGKFHEKALRRFHGIIGYEMLKEQDKLVARVCLSHTFQFNKLPPYDKVEEMFFHVKEDYEAAKNFFAAHSASEYDRLIQLCDFLANGCGLVTLQQRFDEAYQRHKMPVPAYFIEGTEKLKAMFDKVLGFDLYMLYDKISDDFMLHPGCDVK